MVAYRVMVCDGSQRLSEAQGDGYYRVDRWTLQEGQTQKTPGYAGAVARELLGGCPP